MNEAQFQSKFTAWIKKNAWASAAFELKITKTNTLPFSKIEEHQLLSLERAKDGTLAHKISDMALGFKPLDMMVLHKAEAYLVVMFWKPRQKQVFYLMDIGWVTDLIRNQKQKRRSFSEKDCSIYGTQCSFDKKVDLESLRHIGQFA